MSIPGKERRREQRHALQTDATIQVVENGEALSGKTHDVSFSGFALVLDQCAHLEVGEEVVCEVSVPGDSPKQKSAWGRGKLVRVSENQAAILLANGSLEPTLCQPCPCCHGTGSVMSITTLCYDILTTARTAAAAMEAGSVTLVVHADIANALKTHKATLVQEFEGLTRKAVKIETNTAAHWAQYEIR